MERSDLHPAQQKSRPDILFVSHCVPNPPDKGEKIRAFHLIHYLASRYRVHLACFARNNSEVAEAQELKSICTSLYVQKLSDVRLIRGVLRLLSGGCLNTGYYWSPRMKRYVDEIAQQVDLRATLVYSVVMMTYSPENIPVILDMQDVDSEKWFAYAQSRAPRFLYNLEAKRLREFESESAKAAKCTVLTTRNEEELLRSMTSDITTTYMENGVDMNYFDCNPRPLPTGFEGRRFVAFIGTMNYYPNIDGVRWFAKSVFPQLRRSDPSLEFLVIGRHPVKAVRELSSIDGVTITGGVQDIRPFLTHALAIVAPLRIARGIQNKVLEALAMGRTVYASEAVCRTFGEELPPGTVLCTSEEEFISRLQLSCWRAPEANEEVRQAAHARFSWAHGLQTIGRKLDEIIECGGMSAEARGL